MTTEQFLKRSLCYLEKDEENDREKPVKREKQTEKDEDVTEKLSFNDLFMPTNLIQSGK